MVAFVLIFSAKCGSFFMYLTLVIFFGQLNTVGKGDFITGICAKKNSIDTKKIKQTVGTRGVTGETIFHYIPAKKKAYSVN